MKKRCPCNHGFTVCHKSITDVQKFSVPETYMYTDVNHLVVHVLAESVPEVADSNTDGVLKDMGVGDKKRVVQELG